VIAASEPTDRRRASWPACHSASLSASRFACRVCSERFRPASGEDAAQALWRARCYQSAISLLCRQPHAADPAFCQTAGRLHSCGAGETLHSCSGCGFSPSSRPFTSFRPSTTRCSNRWQRTSTSTTSTSLPITRRSRIRTMSSLPTGQRSSGCMHRFSTC